MARIKLQLPERKIFDTKIAVRITDINYGNHLGNDSLVGIIHEARVQWLQSLGYSELKIETVGLIMSDLAVEYKNESFYGDTLTIRIFVGDISSVSFELYYHIFQQQEKEIAKAKTGMVCYDYMAEKVVGIPAGLMKALNPGL
jgi:acyl-CoA thioester hydrolase